MVRLVYFSTKSENTHRFVKQLGFSAYRLPLTSEQPDENHDNHSWVIQSVAQEPFVLITPTYGGGHTKGAVPPQVIRFLNIEANRKLLRGVIACGDTNFGVGFCRSGPIIAQKCGVPHLHNIEMFGTPHDCEKVRNSLIDFWAKDGNMNPP